MRKSNAEKAYEEIKTMITERKISPGQQIVEGNVAKVLDISRTPVREAMRRLQEEGLVEIIPNKGSYLKIISYDEMANSYEVIEAISAQGYKILAENRAEGKLTDLQMEELRADAQELKECYEKQDLRRWSQLDIEFHMKMIEMTGNSFLVKSYANMRYYNNQVLWYITPFLVDKGISVQEHFEILEAIERADAEGVILKGHKHVDRIVRQIRSLT